MRRIADTPQAPRQVRVGPQPDSESAVDNATDPLPGGPWRIRSPKIARRVAPPLSLLRHSGRSVYARPRVTPIGRTDMNTMRIMTAVALAAVFAVSTASAQQPTTQRVAGTLEKVEGNTLYIKAASGPVILKLADNALVIARI